ncbi:class IV adenylate cyclase [Pyrococcus abyssi]|uniref:Adenylyl cyclase, CyaB-type, putative n=1 Tax=Pyrococcus abyssi (strain GE5 / Orsay) TaxID=272844 RepID=Q9V028_PYRAB|nr:class IV adenylate cyclase [Pyrococcus abyssi]CAB49878.1 cyaB-like1 adenylyl cyclase, CyaB-type, putative [Pyrococcus abyssi GE5]CCE70376.1 TPA: adenylyl cyclase, CyaB-type, putative [Pyrococcus abyssi GE5]
MEIEIKFRVSEDIKERLESLNAKFVGLEVQEDVYFDVPLPKLLRVRRISNLGKSYITYKEIMDRNNEEFYEVEFEVSDFNLAIEVFKRLGFDVKASIKKERLIYKLGDVTFELNKIPGLGNFLDIEVISDDPEEAKRKIWEVAEKLGLKKKDVEPRLYIELVNELSSRSS